MKKTVLLSLVSCLLSLVCSAQYKQGVKYYESFQYAKAIPCLKKAANKNNAHKTDATIKLADSYRDIKDYKDAEVYYQKIIGKGGDTIPAIVHYNYATVLKNNNKYDEALKEFTTYLKSNPNDAKAKNSVKSFQDIKVWQSLPKEYEVTNLSEINTKKSEFCPFIYPTEGGSKLFYTSWQKPDLVNFESDDFDGHPYLNIYYSDVKNDVPESNKKSFSRKINSSYHAGPICFSKQNELFVTRVGYAKHKKDKAFVNRPQLFTSVKSGKNWSKPQPFQYNNIDYSLAHACISDDSNYLFFSSDMPGGNGGMDIWVCKKNSAGWDKPVNLGSDINTPGNEEFPFIRADGMLFFSSDALPGFGGLDVFSARQIAGKWILNRNEGVGINSLADDFGIFFIDNTKGYISSNRDGGKGNDDIYKFTFTQKLISVDGTVLNSQDVGDVAKDVKVILEDSKGNPLNDARTNSEGYFRFDNLSPDNKYMVKMDENDASFSHHKRYFFMDSKGEVMRVSVVNDKGEKFVFKNLPADANSLPQLDSPDDVTLAGNLLYGENPSLPIANKKVLLKDENGNVVDEATTNAFGAFVFNKIPTGDSYFISLAENDASLPVGTKIILTNKSGKQLNVLNSGDKGSFKFGLLASDKAMMDGLKVADADLLMNVAGRILGPDKKPLGKINVFLVYYNKVAVIDTSKTDSTGTFKFDKLQAAGNYVLNVDENDAALKNFDKIFITDLKGKIIRELIRSKYKGFSFNLLQADKSSLKDIYVEDPWLDVLNMKDSKKKEDITIVESVNYALNAYKFDEGGQRVIDKVIQIMKNNPAINIDISSHTDAQGDDKTNLLLSQKRAKFAVDYMISKGVTAKRLKSIGYGESLLINKCGNNIQCLEEEHAKNRRTEFKIIDTGKK
ncbi:MAG TPA: OmpA family protein [Bacteroidia bacterium]